MTDQPNPDRRRHAIAFNALGVAIKASGEWMPFTARQKAVDAVLEAVDADARNAARQTDIEPQDHPGADLYVRLLKAGEDHDTAQALIYAHARMAVRQHTAIHGDTPAVGQPAEAHTTDEPLTAAERQFLTFALDLADNRMANRSDEFTTEDYEALAAFRRMAEEARS
ncbi:hypothetical protein [Streptomyces gardneri]|uniref:hypothetical protein n=1 Tax=Streptomyces gardneri TaxID=66892 RepID=UPI0035E07296